MTSSKTNGNYDKVMEGVNKALPQIADGLHRLADRTASAAGIAVHQPQTAKSGIYTRIADNLARVNDMLNGKKAEEYGNPRAMFQNISQRWFGCDDAEVDVAIMMAELKIEHIKFDPTKEDSYMDAIAYLAMALAFMQEGKKMLNDITIEHFVEYQDLILPYTEKQLNPNSYDVTLQDTIIIFTSDVEDCYCYADGGDHTLHGVRTESVKIDGYYMLQPGQFVLGATVEKISLPDNMMARFDGKSSLGRLGLCTHVTAGFIDAGFIGTITVELKNENSFPIMLKPGMRIGQVSFEYLNATAAKPYGLVGHYQNQNAPQPAVEV